MKKKGKQIERSIFPYKIPRAGGIWKSFFTELRAVSGPLADIILFSNLIVWDMGKRFPSVLAGVGRGALSWVQDTWHLTLRLGSTVVWALGQGGAQCTLKIVLFLPLMHL